MLSAHGRRKSFDGDLTVNLPEGMTDTKGRYTPACILAIITNLFQALASSYPSASHRLDIDMPSLLTFTPIPESILSEIRSLPVNLELPADLCVYLSDTMLVSTDGIDYCRLWGGSDDRNSQTRRLKAELLLTSDGLKIISAPSGAAEIPTSPETLLSSPCESLSSLVQTDAPTEDEVEATTPDLSATLFVEPMRDMSKFDLSPFTSAFDIDVSL